MFNLNGTHFTPLPHRFDIFQFGSEIGGREDEAGILETQRALNDLIAVQDVPASRVVLGGFSQGGVMALLAALTSTHRLGGAFVLSGRLALPQRAKEASTSLRLFIQGHIPHSFLRDRGG